MAGTKFCGLSPSMLFGRRSCKFQAKKRLLDVVRGSYPPKNEKEVRGVRINNLFGSATNNLKLMAKLKGKITAFRDMIDLPPFDYSMPIDKLVIRTIKDLQEMYPAIIPRNKVSEMERASMDQVLANFSKTLKSIEDSWTMNQDTMDIFDCDIQGNEESSSPEQHVENILRKLDSLTKIAKGRFDMLEKEDEKRSPSPQTSSISKNLESYSDSCRNSFCASPATPTSVLPELTKMAKYVNASSPFLMSLSMQAVGKLNPIDVKRLTLHMLSHVEIEDSTALYQKINRNQKQMQDEKGNSQAKKSDPVKEAKGKCQESQISKNSPTTSTDMLLPTSSRPYLSTNIVPPPPPLPPLPLLPPPAMSQPIIVNPPMPPPTPQFQSYLSTSPPQTRLAMSQPNMVHPPTPPPTPQFQSYLSTSPPQTQLAMSQPNIVHPPTPPPTPQFQSYLSTSPPPPPMSQSNIVNPSMPSLTPQFQSYLSTSPPPPPPAVISQSNIVNPPTSLPTLQFQSYLSTSPPPPAAMSQPNIVNPPTPPPTPQFQSYLSTSPPSSPPPPPPMLQPNVTVEQPLPPPPPPQLGTSATPFSPPPSPGTLEATLPSLPPLLGILGATQPSPPSPPGMSRVTLPSPPPPPRMLGVTPPSPPLPPGMSRASPPSPPPSPESSRVTPPPPPAMMPVGNRPHPPPPPTLGATRSLRPKKATKLKRSSQIASLYRLLKGKVEGNDLCKLSSEKRNLGVGAPAAGKQGMADALAEITKKSAFFQQIEEDIEMYAKSITELKSSIIAFETKDMAELLKFQNRVESILEKLTDESQVLARFEGFPSKKLETLRTAAALYSKLDAMATELQNWKIEAPLSQQLDKVEKYFNKMKGEIEALEMAKDEESKKFQIHNIHFDFHIVIKIKELMVDVSSNCMEFALKERKAAKELQVSGTTTEARKKECVKMLWRAFQFAFRVYNFAGGHDDRADKLTRELAHEIETDPQNQ